MFSKKIILGFVGEIASGKGTVAKYLENKYKAETIRFSTPLRDVLKRLYLDISRENMQNLSQILRVQFGQDLLAKIISEDAKGSNAQLTIIDGIRREPDIKYLNEIPEFKLVYITTDIKTRYERLIKRGENKDDVNKTFEQFLKDNQAEAEKDISKVSESANYKIDNSGNLDDLYNEIERILKNC